MKKFKIDHNLYEELSEEEMLNRYKPLIKSSAFKYYSYYQGIAVDHIAKLDKEDFEQHGNIALIESYRTYDLSYDTLFYTVLKIKLDGAMNRLIRDTLKIRSVDSSLLSRRLFSIESSIGNSNEGDKEITLEDSIADETDYIEDCENKILAEKFLSVLSEQERNVVIDYYYGNKTQVELSCKYNTSQVQISRILKRSTKKMKNSMKAKGENKMANYNSIQLNISEAKQFISDKLNNEKMNMTKAIMLYARKIGVSESTVSSRLKKEEPDFIRECKIISKRNVSIDAIKRNAEEKNLYKNKDVITSEPIKTFDAPVNQIIKSSELELLETLNKVDEIVIDIKHKNIGYEISKEGTEISTGEDKDIFSDNDLKDLCEGVQTVLKIRKLLYN